MDLEDFSKATKVKIDRSRVLLDLQPVKTMLGYQQRPKFHWRKKNSAQWEVAVEKPAYDLTIFKLHCGKLTLKIYTKGEGSRDPHSALCVVIRSPGISGFAVLGP